MDQLQTEQPARTSTRIASTADAGQARSVLLVVPVRLLDATTRGRMDGHREARPARWDYDALFEREDGGLDA
jgi:hypothetical protein